MEINSCYLGLGTNLGDRLNHLNIAQQFIEHTIGKISSKSNIYETPPLGFDSSDAFLNMVIKVETTLSPEGLLNSLKDIELKMGRKNKSVNGVYSSRIIDIDILLYNELQVTTNELVIPHPAIIDRKFVLVPLMDIAPDLKFPNGQSITRVFENCKDNSTLSLLKK